MKSNLERKWFVWLTVYSPPCRKIRAETQGINMEAETKTEVIEGQSSLT